MEQSFKTSTKNPAKKGEVSLILFLSLKQRNTNSQFPFHQLNVWHLHTYRLPIKQNEYQR